MELNKVIQLVKEFKVIELLEAGFFSVSYDRYGAQVMGIFEESHPEPFQNISLEKEELGKLVLSHSDGVTRYYSYKEDRVEITIITRVSDTAPVNLEVALALKENANAL
jgi:hypothetical protein